jgi:hypothetical protein
MGVLGRGIVLASRKFKHLDYAYENDWAKSQPSSNQDRTVL